MVSIVVSGSMKQHLSVMIYIMAGQGSERSVFGLHTSRQSAFTSDTG
jgi:hypothetical protein